MKASLPVRKYYQQLEEKANQEYGIAEKARAKGLDPETKVEIPLAKGIGERVEGLVGPEGVGEDIDKLLKTKSREEVTLEIINKIINDEYGTLSQGEKAEQSVRTALTLLTEGVVAAPLEGISSVEIEENPDGTRYLTISYAGPIRSAGGTGQAMSVLVADYTRKMLGLEEYRPTKSEVERYVEEINIYHNVVSRLQYKPSDEEIREIVKNCKVCISGTPTTQQEVNVHKNLDRIPSNRVRGGMCLVIGEGIAQKAPRLVGHARKLGLNWDWLQKIIKVEKVKTGKEELKPNPGYLKDVVAGRPIISYPSLAGGFRLRYGRGRNTGLMSKAVHPATMIVLDEFPAIGTQFKLERPGKGTTLVSCDSIQGPVVRLKNGKVMQLDTQEKARKVKDRISEVLFLGDLLVSFGDFLKAKHPIVPSAWTEEWWQLELEEKNGKCEDPYQVSWEQALEYSQKYDIALHPRYVFPYHNLSVEQLEKLVNWLENGCEMGPEKRILEELLVPHHVEGEKIVIEEPYRQALFTTLSIGNTEEVIGRVEANTAMELIRELAPFEVKEKSPVYIGARMGRPEKAKQRLMRPAPHLLFPVGNQGGNTRSVMKARGKGVISVEMINRKCPECGKLLASWTCPECGSRAEVETVCSQCGRPVKEEEEECPSCGGRPIPYTKKAINLKETVDQAIQKVGKPGEKLKGVKGTISPSKANEPLEKGLLRSQNNVFVFKDGTIRFDATNLVLTHFRPAEIGTSVEKLRELGYTQDKDGKPLEREDQLVELFPQDVIPSKKAAEYLLRVSKFVDKELEKMYGLEPYYQCQKTEDLIGAMVIGLAPHTSAGVLGRIIGFTDAYGCYGHPYFHAACRRDCFAYDETLPIFDGEKWRIVKIGEFIEKLLKEKKARKTEFGDLVIETNGYQTISLNEKGEYQLKNLTAFSKHPPQNHTVRLRTKNGRSITTSGMHSFLQEESKTPAFQTKRLLSPKKFSIPSRDVKEIDILDHADENTMIVGMKEKLKEYLDQKGLGKTVQELGMNKKTLFDYYERDSVPLSTAEELGIPIPRKVKVKTKWDKQVIPRMIKLDKDFLRLLGLYVAEGRYRKKDKSFYQVSIALTKNKEETRKTIKRVFNLEPTPGKHSFTISSRLIYNLFRDLGCGRTAKQKRVPSLVLGLPLEKVRWFLQGYFQGDGGISQAKGNRSPEVSCTSSSKMLLRDIEFLLTRFGLTTSWQKDHRKMTTGKVAEKYRKKGEVLEWTYYKLRMYAKTTQKFCQEIGFWFPDKNQKAERIIKDYNFQPKRHQVKQNSIINPVKKTELIKKTQPLYNFTVEDTHNAVVSGITTKQCDGDEDSLMLLMDALINFSKHYLPATRGGQMDACLVLTTVLDPSQVDDQVHDMDIAPRMPLEFYRRSHEMLNPSDFQVSLVKHRLGKENQYNGFSFTHDTRDINQGVYRSSYTTLKSMQEKVEAQLGLGKKIKAVDEQDEAKRIIESHFLRDIYGNLRAFGEQKFRCVNCNAKYRRVPLIGKCTKCGGRVILTVAEGSVKKYLKVSQDIARKYGLPDYMNQRLKLLEKDIESVFSSDKVTQQALTEFM